MTREAEPARWTPAWNFNFPIHLLRSVVIRATSPIFLVCSSDHPRWPSTLSLNSWAGHLSTSPLVCSPCSLTRPSPPRMPIPARSEGAPMFSSNDSSRSAWTHMYDRLRGVFRGADPRVCVAFWLFGLLRFNVQRSRQNRSPETSTNPSFSF
jgi:hypothetical protein